MREVFPGARYDLCTCFPGLPRLPAGEFENVYRVSEAAGAFNKLRMILAVRRSRPSIVGAIFSAEPIMAPWRLALLAALPAKVVVINENGDFFWLDWANRRTLRQFLRTRAGLDASGLLQGAYKAVVFPFVVAFLALTAVGLYARRWLRLLTWNLAGRGRA